MGRRPLPDDPYGQQTKVEFDWWLGYVRGAKSILEIGSCFGHSLRMMAAVAPGSLVRCIDIKVNPYLLGALDDLRSHCHDVDARFDCSQSPASREWAARWATYDIVFIDGDHSDDGVEADWVNYGQMGRIVAFHDVGGMVKRFWAKLKRDFRTEENIAGHNGIGVVFRELNA